MSGKFFDSNALLYLLSKEQDRVDRVTELLDGGGTISVQVLNEMASVCRRKFQMSWRDTSIFLDKTTTLMTIIPLTVGVHRTGLRLAERYGFSIYDSFIVAAALQAGCETLWSEDMHDGLLVDDRLRIVNPFDAVA
jgi:predicted nucleic acid-binding protein